MIGLKIYNRTCAHDCVDSFVCTYVCVDVFQYILSFVHACIFLTLSLSVRETQIERERETILQGTSYRLRYLLQCYRELTTEK